MKNLFPALASVTLTTTALLLTPTQLYAENLLPARQVPQTVHLLSSGPGNTLQFSFGHVDLLLSYGSTMRSNDRVVGFGPKINEGFSLGRILGGRNAYPMDMWNISFLERFEEAIQYKRPWLRVYTLTLTQKEKAELVKVLNAIHGNIEDYRFQVLSYNCSTMIMEILEAVTGLDVRARSVPLSRLEKRLRKLGLIENSYEFSQEYMQEYVQRISSP